MSKFDVALHYIKVVRVLGLRPGIAACFKKLAAYVGIHERGHKTSAVYLHDFAGPIFLRLDTSDWSVFRDVFVNKEYSEPSKPQATALRNYYARIIEGGKVPIIIDCGANIGLATIWYANQFPEARIVAVEPELLNFEILERNTSNIKNVQIVNAAISNKRSRIALKNQADSPWAWQIEEDSAGELTSITISDTLDMIPGGVPFILKVDIEGHENELFASNYADLIRFPLIVCEHHDWLYAWRGSAHAIFHALTSSEVRDYLQRSENTFCYSHKILRSAD